MNTRLIQVLNIRYDLPIKTNEDASYAYMTYTIEHLKKVWSWKRFRWVKVWVSAYASNDKDHAEKLFNLMIKD